MLCLVLKCVFYLYLVERKVDFKTMNSSVKRKEYYERLGLDEGASTGVLCVSAEWSQFLLSVSSKHETIGFVATDDIDTTGCFPHGVSTTAVIMPISTRRLPLFFFVFWLLFLR